MVVVMPIVPAMMPVAIMADAARAVMSQDHPAAVRRIIVRAVVRIGVDAIEVAMMEVRPIRMAKTGMIAAAIMDAAAMEDSTTAVESRAATVEGSTAAVESGAAAMEGSTAAVESGATTTMKGRSSVEASATAAVKTAAASTATAVEAATATPTRTGTTTTATPTGTVMPTRTGDLDGRRLDRRTRGRLRARTHRRHRLSGPPRSPGKHDQCGRRKAEATGKTTSRVLHPHHDHFSLVQATKSSRHFGRLSVTLLRSPQHERRDSDVNAA
jgi:hypothetical protein